MFNDNIAWKAEKIITSEYEAIEEELLRRFVKDVSAGKKVKDIAEWRRDKLREISVYSSSWEDTLNRLVAEHQKAVDSAVRTGLTEAAESDDDIFRRMFDKITKGASTEAFTQRLQAALRTCHSYMNLSNTRAIAKMQEDFLEIVNRAYIRVLTGVSTLDQEIRTACYEYAKQGVQVQYVTDSGKIINYAFDAAVRRDIMTTIGQTAAAFTIQRNEEYGNDLVQVSAHFGARPSHALWQGKVYSLTGKTKGYALLSEATGYGTVTGLCGANCRHTFWPYFAGYSKEEQEKAGLTENRKQYENQQKQRAYERIIRRYKRERIAAKETGDDVRLKKINERYKATRAEYLQFLKDNNLTRFAERERVYG